MKNEERETIIRRSASDKTFDVWSNVPRDMRRLCKSAEAFGCEVEDEESGAIRIRDLPIAAITFRASRGHGKPGGNIEALRKYVQNARLRESK